MPSPWAKVLVLPLEEDYEILPVIAGHYALALLAPEDADENVDEGVEFSSSELFSMFVHGLHHELCHVHDDNRQIDAFGTPKLNHLYQGKDMLTRPLAEACWSEYIADLMSSSTADTVWLGAIVKSFGDAIARTKPHLDGEVLAYRHHGDLGRLVDEFERHAGFPRQVGGVRAGVR